jgi:hypothetical protein
MHPYFEQRMASKAPDMNGALWAVTSYYNPAGYQRRKANYDVFRDRLRLPLLTVEWSQTGQFALGPADAERLIQLDGGDVMWQKERLLNIAIAHLPPQCTHVAWLDCDLIFEREDLGDAIVAALDAAPLVQLFDRAAHLPCIPLDALARLDCARTAEVFELPGAAAAHEAAARAGLPPPIQTALDDRDSLGPKPSIGFAWAARRDLLERHPLFDEWVIGGGDSAFFHAAIGVPELVVQNLSLVGVRRDHFLARAQDLARAISHVGHVPGRVFTLWHGKLANRRYHSRHAILARHGFDPLRDLRISASGAWEWAASAPSGLRKEVRAYFEQRDEDGLLAGSAPAGHGAAA